MWLLLLLYDSRPTFVTAELLTCAVPCTARSRSSSLVPSIASTPSLLFAPNSLKSSCSWYLSFASFSSYAYAITPFVLGYGLKSFHQHRKGAQGRDPARELRNMFELEY